MSPRAARTRRNTTNNTLEEPADPITPPREEGDDVDLPIFTQLKRYSETEWDRLLVYLYRLEPRVKNSDGPAYIEKFGRAIDEDDIKNAHGGGKYQVWLKDTATDETIRKVNVTIAGAPILQSNQILQPNAAASAVNPAAPAAAASPTSAADPNFTALVTLLTNTLQDLKSRNVPQEEANKIMLDTMRQANAGAIELMKNSLGSQSGSMTGNTIADEMMKQMIAEMRAKKDPLAELKGTIALVKEIRGEPKNAEPSDPLSSLKNLKDVLGFDLKELLEKRGTGDGGGEGPHWSQPLVASLPQLIGEIPKVFEQLNQGKRIELEIVRMQFERERLHIAARANGIALPASPPAPGGPGAPAGIAAPPAAAISSAPPAAPATAFPANVVPGVAPAAPATPAATPEAEFDRAAELVVRSFNEGYSGDLAVAVLRVAHPTVVMQLAPFAESKEMISGVVAGHPILATITTDEDYPTFFDEFVTALTQGEEEELETIGATKTA